MDIKTPHKHAELIKAWADGAKIQIKTTEGWVDLNMQPWWSTESEYRIKPEPEPDKLRDYQVEFPAGSTSPRWHQKALCNLRLVFDGETGTLKSAEIL